LGNITLRRQKAGAEQGEPGNFRVPRPASSPLVSNFLEPSKLPSELYSKTVLRRGLSERNPGQTQS